MTDDREAKQVIVMRTDLGMRKGKMIAQGAHASIAFLTAFGNNVHQDVDGRGCLDVELTAPQVAWCKGIFTKICVRVDSEDELYSIATQAREAGLTVNLIADAGLTEFHGVETLTCCAIGPDWGDEIDLITGELTLL